jgi:hypothetical protein
LNNIFPDQILSSVPGKCEEKLNVLNPPFVGRDVAATVPVNTFDKPLTHEHFVAANAA